MLSKRLSIIYSFIDEGSSVVDVGCDHGYLLIELAKNNKSTNLLGVENKLGPFSTLNKNIKLNKLDGKINTSLSDGISNVDSSFDTLVIAGMGSDNIVGIIERNKDKLSLFNTIIIDSHTETEKIRRYFVKKYYKISNEKIIKDNKIVYEIIKFVKGKANYSDLEFKYGPIILNNKNDEEFKEIYKERVQYLTKKLENATNEKFKNNLSNEIEEISSILR
ncbi:MAG: class I SAM-dependent methyltransferase [Candidatus Onthovivens sp.]|nr:class I SAM-dependent methyltransferase [Candidatus Onthovivens sp.]